MSRSPGDTLRAALQAILPGPAETQLLAASLSSGEAARAAWRRCREQIPDLLAHLRADRWGAKRLAPLLFVALRSADEPVDGELQTVLKTAFLRERLRYEGFRLVLLQVLGSLAERGLDAVLLRGAAAAQTVYPEPSLRHTHGIELLVREEQELEVAERLTQLGLARVAGTGELSDDLGGGRLFRHASGVPVHVATTLFSVPRYGARLEEVWPRTREVVCERLALRVLGPEDALVDVCGHASHSPPHEWSLWVCDAWLLLREPSGIDWRACLDSVRRRGLAPIVSVCCDYLAARLAAPVAAETLAALRSAADEIDALDRDLALFWLRVRAGVGARGLLHSVGDWRDRGRLLGWLLFPSAQYMEYAQRGQRLPLPLAYARRFASRLGG